MYTTCTQRLNTSFMWLAPYPGFPFYQNRRFCLFFTKYMFTIFFCFMISWLLFIYTFSLLTAESSQRNIENFYLSLAFFLANVKTLWFYKDRNKFRECLEIFKPEFLKCMNHNVKRHREVYNSGVRECNSIYFIWSLVCLLYTSRCV